MLISFAAATSAIGAIAHSADTASAIKSTASFVPAIAITPEDLVSLVVASSLLTSTGVLLTLLVTNVFIVPWFERFLDRRIDRQIKAGKLPPLPVRGESK